MLNFNVSNLYRVGGIVFSSLLSDSVSVGASTSIFGLIGAYVRYRYWHSIDCISDKQLEDNGRAVVVIAAKAFSFNVRGNNSAYEFYAR